MTRWLWKGRVPMGKVTVLDGAPGAFKSTVALDIAARVSRGREMPGGGRGVAASSVVLALCHDCLPHVAWPRLEAAGADCTRVQAINTVEYRPTFREDIDAVADALRRVDARLLVIDHLVEGDVPEGLKAMAQREGLAVIAVGKASSVGSVLWVREGEDGAYVLDSNNAAAPLVFRPEAAGTSVRLRWGRERIRR